VSVLTFKSWYMMKSVFYQKTSPPSILCCAACELISDSFITAFLNQNVETGMI